MRKSTKNWIHLIVLLLIASSSTYFVLDWTAPETISQTTSLLKPRVLVHDLKGVIVSGDQWIKKVTPYLKKKNIAAFVFIVNSPGGVVGPSQELYHFLKHIRDEEKKPVVVYSNQVLASGAYYTALGANHIITAPGTLVGSVGVIMEFLNLEGLYDWAKIKRFSITSGKYKDSGAEWRSMREDERELFEKLIGNVYQQFIEAVKKERQMSPEAIAESTDGRILTGLQAMELGLIDQIGSLKDALNKAAELAGYSELEPTYIKSDRPSWLQWFTVDEEAGSSQALNIPQRLMNRLLPKDLLGRPLYLLPGIPFDEMVK